MDKNDRILKFEYATKVGGKTILHVNELVEKSGFFTIPFSSSKINIYVSDVNNVRKMECEIQVIKCKLICLTFKSKFDFQPWAKAMHVFDYPYFA